MGKKSPKMQPLNEKAVSGKKRRRVKKVFEKGTTVSSETYGVGTVIREGTGGFMVCDFGGSVREVLKDNLAIREDDKPEEYEEVSVESFDDVGTIGDTDNGVSDD